MNNFSGRFASWCRIVAFAQNVLTADYGVVAEVLGHGGTATVHEITGSSHNTITNGMKEADT